MSHWMFNCQEISKKVSQSMDDHLALHERMMIAVHLWMCKYCRRFKAQMRILRNALRLTDLPWEDEDRSLSLPIEARERIKMSLRKIPTESIK